MIAERPTTKPSGVEETEDNLFEGLSFPDVPTAPIAPVYVSPAVVPKPPEVLQRPESKLSPTEHVNVKNPPVGSEAGKKSGNLSALYATEVVTSDSRTLYPELPSFADHLAEEDHNAYNNYAASQYEESASLLPRVNALSPQSQHQLQDSAHQNPELVTELVMENSRLAEEVANLKRMLDDQQGATNAMHGGLMHNNSSSTSSRRGVTAMPQSQQAHIQHNQQQQQQMQQVPGVGMVGQTANNTITGVQITDTTRPPEKGVKYVCCGGCRQWLMAPRDAVYVVCAQCDAINNCNLAPKDSTDAHNRAAETRVLTQRNNGNDNMFWFLDCFSRGLF